MHWPWSKKRSELKPVDPELMETLQGAKSFIDKLDAHTYHFGALAENPKPERTPHDVFVRYISPADGFFQKSFTNLAARDIEDARDMAQRGRRKFAMGASKICPIVVVRVYWKGAIKTLVEKQ